MKVLKRPGSVALLVGILLLLLTGGFFMSGAGFAALKCLECDCRYELGKPGCQTPVIYIGISYVTFFGAVCFVIAAWFRRRRSRRAVLGA